MPKHQKDTDNPAAETKSVLKYPGAKWAIAEWIIQHMPRHEVYVEPFFGSGAVFFTKQPARVEIINDRDDQVVNLYRVLRDRPDELIRAVMLTPVSLTEHHAAYDGEPTGDPVEDARIILVKAWQSFGGRIINRAGWRRNYTATRSTIDDWLGLPERIVNVIERLKYASIENEDAIALLGRYKHPDTLIYCDPPYPFSVRSDTVHDRYYRTEMGKDDEHVAMLEALILHPGMVMLSGYRCELYESRLVGWKRIDRPARAQMGIPKIESLWINPRGAARAQHQMTIFDALQEGAMP